MPTVNAEVRKVVKQLRGFQKQFHDLVKNKGLVEDARRFAEKHGKELRKLVKADAAKVKSFIEKQKDELESMQKRIPSEITKIRKYVDSQKREFEKVIKNLNTTTVIRSTKGKKTTAKKSAGGAKRSTAAARTVTKPKRSKATQMSSQTAPAAAVQADASASETNA